MTLRILNLVFALLMCYGIAYPQAESAKWGIVSKSYCPEPKESTDELTSLPFDSFRDYILNPLFIAYHYGISVPDGSRCPFTPSCSAFFFQSAKSGPFLPAVFLTMDRLTRDANFINRSSLYRQDKHSHKLLDEPAKYLQALRETNSP